MKSLFLYICLIFPLSQLIEQVDNASNFSVEWIKEISYEEDINTDDNVISNLLKMVTGESELRLVKPFNLVQIDSSSYFILDQGLSAPILASENGFELIGMDKYNSFPSLVGVCKFKQNKILFTDSKLSKIFIYDRLNEEVKIFDTKAKLDKPTGLAYNPIQNKIYVTETDKHRISVLSDDGELINTIGSRGDKEGHFNYPSFLALDNNWNLYVVDALNFRVQIFDDNGNFLKTFGEAGDATGFFNRPKGIKIDSYGHIFLVDAMFHTIQVFNMDGNFLYNFGGLGSQASRFWLPIGIDIDEKNNICIADSYNARIQIFRLIDGEN